MRGACVAAITSLDPARSKLGICDVSAYNALYNTLVRTTATGNIVPELATSWEVSQDAKVYTFRLRPGVKFHDGTQLDAEAVKFGLERMRDTVGSPAATTLQVMEAVEVADAQTVRVRLSAPSVPFLSQLGSSVNGPIVSPSAVRSLGEAFQRQGVGTGPFKIVSWTPGDKAVFQRFDGYWEKAADGSALPYLDGLELNGVPDDTARLLNLRSGQFELNERVNPKDVAAVTADRSLQVIQTATGTAYMVALNVTKPPFDNKLLRQAVAAALNREAIIQNVGFGSGYTTPMPFPKGAWFFMTEPSPKYDPALAKQTLAEAGFPGGIEVNLSIISRPVDQQIAQIVKANLDEAGIRTTLEALERTAWVDRWTGRRGEVGILQRGIMPTDPDDQMIFFDPKAVANFAGFDNPRMTELVQRAQRTSEQATRKQLYAEITRLNMEEAAYIFIGAVPTVGATGIGARDVAVDPSSAWLLSKAWVAR